MARRTRSPHPGVVLIPPDASRAAWRARYVDPDTGRVVKVRLDPTELRTAEARRDWAVRKSKALAKRAMAIDDGAPRATGTAIGDAVDRYFRDHPHLKSETTYKYKAAASKLLAWAARHGVKSADDLTGPKLVAFRSSLMTEPKVAPSRGSLRGARRPAGEPRKPITVNAELRSVGTVLSYLRSLGLLPRITSDHLKDGLKKLPVAAGRVDYRKPNELQKLLEAALRHDADTFAATRDEHAGLLPPGSTPRHKPIAPFVAGAVITGLRVSHLLALEWAHVDLEALDHDGKPVGEIVPPSGSYTKRAGVVGLEVSPALRKMLAAMHLQSGGRGSVFGLTDGEARTALRRLITEYGAPARATWQSLRRTCGCYLTNAPGIFGAASAYRSAKQLGHSVQIAEKHYVDVIRGIPRDARTLEAAMQIEDQMRAVIESVSGPRARRKAIG